MDLERRGEVVIARSIADVDAARDGGTPPVAVMHLEGAEAIDSGLEMLAAWYERGLRSLGPVWSRPNAFAHGVPFALSLLPRHRPGADRQRQSPRPGLRRARHPRRPQPPQRGGLLGRGAPPTGAAGREPLRRPRALPRLAQPHRPPARRDRRQRRPGRDRLRHPLPAPRLRRRRRHPARADRRACPLRRRPHRGRATSPSARTSTARRSPPLWATPPAFPASWRRCQTAGFERSRDRSDLLAQLAAGAGGLVAVSRVYMRSVYA